MNDLDTREAVRGLANMVKTLAVWTRRVNENGVALMSALEKLHPGTKAAYLEAVARPLSIPEVDRLIDNIDALLQQLETK